MADEQIFVRSAALGCITGPSGAAKRKSRRSSSLEAELPLSSFDLLSKLAAFAPEIPSKWTRHYVNQIVARSNKRVEVLNDRIQGLTAGRVMPDVEQVTIGSGKHFDLSVLFLDICGFSARPNWTSQERTTNVSVMNIFMAEMLNVVRDFGGTFEKNTGDGLMAYFGETASDNPGRVKPAAEAAAVMHCVNDQLMTPWFREHGIEPIRFRIGIDVGPVTIARVGLKGQLSSLVAIGTTANLACKLMNLIPQGGICVGTRAYESLPYRWNSTCRKLDAPTGFVYSLTSQPYSAWELQHRLVIPFV